MAQTQPAQQETQSGPVPTGTPTQRWKWLNRDARPFRRRLLIAAAPCFALTFTLLFFGPMDLYFRNANYVDFTFFDMLLPFLLLFLVTFALLTGLLLLLRGKLLDVLASLVAGLALASWLQGNFLNLDLGTLTGAGIPWGQYLYHGIFNAAVWVLLALLPLALRVFLPKVWNGVLPFLCLLLAAMQLVALVPLLPGAKAGPSVGYYISDNRLFNVSPKENIVVLLLDDFCDGDVRSVLAEDPDAFADFADFTRFDNHSGTVNATFFSVGTILTGYPYEFDKSYGEFLTDAWRSPHAQGFYAALDEAGYASSIYTYYAQLVQDASMMEGVVENIGSSPRQVNVPSMLKMMTMLSVYRYAPHLIKPTFWTSTGDFGNLVHFDGGDNYYLFQNPQGQADFYQRLQEEGLRLREDGRSTFAFYHLNGPHDPAQLNAQVQMDPAATRTSQARATLEVAAEFLRQMRALDVYDSSNIILLADHGTGNDQTPLLMVKRAGDQHDAMQVNTAPVCHLDFIPTVLQMAGLDHTAYGRSYFDVAEDEVRRRTVYMWGHSPNYPETDGSSNIVYAFHFTQPVRQVDFGATDQAEIIPLYDSWH